MAAPYKSIYVAIWLNGAFHPAGIIAFDEKSGTAGFKYLSDYNGPPLDPINLNYRKTGSRVFKVDGRYNVELMHRVFQDGLPGAWGMDVLTAENPEIRKMTAAEKMHWFGNRSVGGISFRIANTPSGENPNKGLEKLAEIRKESIAFFMKQIARIQRKDSLWGLCSHGGARPKTAYEDSNGRQWIVKFNLPLDGYNNSRVEQGIAQMAAKCGIDAVIAKTVRLLDGEEALFVQRFDRDANHRAHQVSMFSMMDETKVKQPHQADYTDMVDIIKRASASPEDDIRELFRRMLYNIAVNNTDDHAKNFSMVLLEEGYRLAPAFDVTPIPYAYPHAMSVCGEAYPDLDEGSVLRYAESFGIPAEEALDTLESIRSVTRDWKQHLEAAGVSQKDIQYLTRAFDNGIDHSPGGRLKKRM